MLPLLLISVTSDKSYLEFANDYPYSLEKFVEHYCTDCQMLDLNK
jgi:hypothetical protein